MANVRVLVAASLVVLAVAGLWPDPAEAWPAIASTVLTSTNGGRILLASDGTSTWARANGGANDARVVWTDPGQPLMVDQEACATWQELGHGVAQPGIALRIRSDGTRTRAVTVTDNVMFGLRFAFNVHVWDTALRTSDGATRIDQIGGVSLREVLFPGNRYVPLPWRMCVRVRGPRLDVKVWPTRQAPPLWGDARYGATFTLPPAFVYAGRPGWYAGHLHGLDTFAQTDQAAGPISEREDLAPGPTGRRPRARP